MTNMVAVLLVWSIMMPLAVVAAQQPGESRRMPIPVGQTGNVGDYEIRVVGVIPDATEMVLAEAPFNLLPETGKVFFIVRIEARYMGQDIGDPWNEVSYNVLGSKNRGYSDTEFSCGFIPDDPTVLPELFPGGSVEFNVCWSVPAEEMSSFVMYAEPLSWSLFSSDEAERVWFSLDVPRTVEAGTPMASPVASAQEVTPAATEGDQPEALFGILPSTIAPGTTLVMFRDSSPVGFVEENVPHTHPFDSIVTLESGSYAFVIERGTLLVMRAGATQPEPAPTGVEVTLGPGDSWASTTDVVWASERVVGDEPVVVVGSYLVEGPVPLPGDQVPAVTGTSAGSRVFARLWRSDPHGGAGRSAPKTSVALRESETPTMGMCGGPCGSSMAGGGPSVWTTSMGPGRSSGTSRPSTRASR